MNDDTSAREVTTQQADAVARAVGLLVTWQDADQSDAHHAMHVEHLFQLVTEDLDDGAEGRLVFGLVALAGQLLTVGAEAIGADELTVLRAIAETYAAASTPAGESAPTGPNIVRRP